jgi:hypothetical protein
VRIRLRGRRKDGGWTDGWIGWMDGRTAGNCADNGRAAPHRPAAAGIPGKQARQRTPPPPPCSRSRIGETDGLNPPLLVSQVYAVIKGIILNGPISFPIRADDAAWALVMGFEHERIHLEVSAGWIVCVMRVGCMMDRVHDGSCA